MLKDELYVEWVLRPRCDEAHSVRARMLREALRLRAAERKARHRTERAAAAGGADRGRRAIGRMFTD